VAGDAGGAAAAAARAAARQVVALTGREFEGVVAIERCDDGWRVCVEVVETRRIPDSADILAVYEVLTGDGGELNRLRRVQRYARGQLNRERGGGR
jgi:Gas vesicle synthesis protein GvpO.